MAHKTKRKPKLEETKGQNRKNPELMGLKLNPPSLRRNKGKTTQNE
jgi:hypothetical protein